MLINRFYEKNIICLMLGELKSSFLICISFQKQYGKMRNVGYIVRAGLIDVGCQRSEERGRIEQGGLEGSQRYSWRGIGVLRIGFDKLGGRESKQ